MLQPSTSVTNTKVTVNNTSTTILAANNGRLGATFVNTSNEEITLSLSGTAVSKEGIPLAASGGAYVMDADGIYTGVITAICASGGKVLSVTELL